jgi:hypothetical protein
MQQGYQLEAKQCWWVRYISKRDLEEQGQTTSPRGNAFFYARDEEALHKDVAGWLKYIKHDGVIVQAIEPVTPDFKLEFSLGPLPQLPAEQAEAVLRAHR